MKQVMSVIIKNQMVAIWRLKNHSKSRIEVCREAPKFISKLANGITVPLPIGTRFSVRFCTSNVVQVIQTYVSRYRALE